MTEFSIIPTKNKTMKVVKNLDEADSQRLVNLLAIEPELTEFVANKSIKADANKILKRIAFIVVGLLSVGYLAFTNIPALSALISGTTP